jgi:hypothetical protein
VTRCLTCGNDQRATIDAMLQARVPLRQVSRVSGVSRSSLSRHAQHVEGLGDRRLVELPAPTEDPRFDHLAEAVALVGRAKTERERLKGLEAVRASTVLALRAMGEPDEEALELLERNLEQAEQAFLDTSGGFEVATRALQGVREAIRQRMQIVRVDGEIETSMSVAFTGLDGKVVPGEPGRPFKQSLSVYFEGVPKQYRDLDKYRVQRTIHLGWQPEDGHEDVKVYDVSSRALVWTKGAS